MTLNIVFFFYQLQSGSDATLKRPRTEPSLAHGNLRYINLAVVINLGNGVVAMGRLDR